MNTNFSAAKEHREHRAENFLVVGIARASGVAEQLIARAAFATGGPVLLDNIGSGDSFDIQWMPPGSQQIACFVKGEDEPRDMSFTVQAAHAVRFNDMLQELRGVAAAGEGDEPYIDFNHEDGAASGRPTEMYWAGDDPKKGGIRLKGRWTGSGKAAIANRDYTRFSPEWAFHKETDEPLGIGVNLGGLVNRAAFQSIAAVAKKPGAASNNNNEERTETMDRKEFQEMLSESLKPLVSDIAALKANAKGATEQTAAAAGATAQAGGLSEDKIVKLFDDRLKPINEKLTAIDTAEKNAQTARAKAAVQVHINRGAIAPEDKETIEFYTDGFLTNPEKAEKAMAKLPGRSMPRVQYAQSSVTGNDGMPHETIIAKAKDIRKADTAIASDAAAMERYLRSPDGRKEYDQYRSLLLEGNLPLPKQQISTAK